MRKRFHIHLGTGIILSLCIGAFFIFQSTNKSTESPISPIRSPVTDLTSTNHYGDQQNLQDQREALHQFIVQQLSGSHGVFTNLIDTDQSADVATGHEVLSESAGLLMRYYALTGQQEAFDAEWNRAKQMFNLHTSFSYRYSPKHDKKYPLNAAIDDLRIIRALYEAGELFKDEQYTKEAASYGSRFLQYNVKDNQLYDFYDETYKITNSFITLCYIDFNTLQRLSDSNTQIQALLTNMQQIVQNGYLSDNFPFYKTSYSYETKTYKSDPINTVESLLTILSLAEIKQHRTESIRYIKEHVKSGTLYGRYTTDGKATTDIQSTAIYAITAMIGSQIGDQELYKDSIRRMNQFVIQDQKSQLNGGYGDPATMQAYSFDNLMALLAYAY